MKYLLFTLLVGAHLIAGETIWESPDNLVLKAFSATEAKQYENEIAMLHIIFFKDFPYLYDGDLESEQAYLEKYLQSNTAKFLILFDNNQAVGISSSIQLSEEIKEIQDDFINTGLNPREYLYIAEVIIHPKYRGQGILRKFFEYHEQYAQLLGYKHLTFITVNRPDNHPLKPFNYRSLEPIWQHFGYEKMNDMKVLFPWKQIDTQKEENNILSLWCKKADYLTK